MCNVPRTYHNKIQGKNRPKLILTDESGTRNLGFSLLDSPADSTVIEAYKDGIRDFYKKTFPSATWIADGVTRINGKKVGYFKIITDAIDQRIFNHMFLTNCDGKLMTGTFNCVEKDIKVWESISDQIVSSIKVR